MFFQLKIFSVNQCSEGIGSKSALNGAHIFLFCFMMSVNHKQFYMAMMDMNVMV